VPYPIQSGAITDRLRKFFRIRGRTGFQLDEMVAPVVLVQDLTKGPYQSGVTPAAGQLPTALPSATTGAMALILNDKPGSVAENLGSQFNGRSFSVTYIEMQYEPSDNPIPLDDVRLSLGPRANVFAGTPSNSEVLIDIQNNDGTRHVPVEMFGFETGLTVLTPIWRGHFGDNTNSVGSRRTIEPTPEITIGPDDALIFMNFTNMAAAINPSNMDIHVRGFYKEEPA